MTRPSVMNSQKCSSFCDKHLNIRQSAKYLTHDDEKHGTKPKNNQVSRHVTQVGKKNIIRNTSLKSEHQFLNLEVRCQGAVVRQDQCPAEYFLLLSWVYTLCSIPPLTTNSQNCMTVQMCNDHHYELPVLHASRSVWSFKEYSPNDQGVNYHHNYLK